MKRAPMPLFDATVFVAVVALLIVVVFVGGDHGVPIALGILFTFGWLRAAI